MKSFLLKLLFYSAFIACVDYFLNRFLAPDFYIPKFEFIVGFFVLLTIIFHFFTIKASKGRPQSLVTFYMGSTALRMFICIIVIILYRFIDKPSFVAFSIAFVVHYFLFMIFEVTTLVKQFRK